MLRVTSARNAAESHTGSPLARHPTPTTAYHRRDILKILARGFDVSRKILTQQGVHLIFLKATVDRRHQTPRNQVDPVEAVQNLRYVGENKRHQTDAGGGGPCLKYGALHELRQNHRAVGLFRRTHHNDTLH